MADPEQDVRQQTAKRGHSVFRNVNGKAAVHPGNLTGPLFMIKMPYSYRALLSTSDACSMNYQDAFQRSASLAHIARLRK
jgi:hypothetical protein